MTMAHSLARLTGALVASAGLAWTGAAGAEPLNTAAPGTGYSAADAPLGAPTELRIDLRGQVAARCEVVPPTGMGRIRLSDAGRVSGAFGIDCNTPFILRIKSANGGLTAIQPLPGIAARTDYALGVEVGTSEGPRTLGWCASIDLAPDAGGSCAFSATAPLGGWSSGAAVAIRQSGEIHMRWDGQDSATPRLGAYQDNIVIEVEIRS